MGEFMGCKVNIIKLIITIIIVILIITRFEDDDKIKRIRTSSKDSDDFVNQERIRQIFYRSWYYHY